MTKLGAGTLALTGSNTNTATSTQGGWLVGAGTLRVSSDANFGVSPGSGVTDLQINQATLDAKFGTGVVNPISGPVFTIFIIVVAAAEAAVGLGIVISMFRNRETVSVDEIDLLKW